MKIIQKGRGAQINPQNRFAQFAYQTDEHFREYLLKEGEDPSMKKETRLIKIYPKSIVNRVNSPDIGKSWSMNPYQGCEHGCAYCYARNSHEFWGYNAGQDFEQVILYKPRAAHLLAKTFQKDSWEPEPIMLSGNTDCYQPAEKKLQITREVLHAFERYRHPVGIITKNSLILRDLDILKKLSERGLLHVSISLTTLDERLRQKLEPRTASVKKRLATIEKLSQHGIPVNVMFAPIIPGLTSHEVMAIAKASSAAGARAFNYTILRLNGHLAIIFMDWVKHHYPTRYEKIKHAVESCHDGKLNDSQFGRRMRGDGKFAEQIAQTVNLARRKFFTERKLPAYNTRDFLKLPRGQFSLGL